VALGLSLPEPQEIHEEFAFGGSTVELYVGTRPKYNVSFTRSEGYIIPSDTTEMFHWESKCDPSQTPFAGNFFVEMTCFSEATIDSETVGRFHADDKPAREQLARIAATHAPKHSRLLDAVSGVLGLRFHRQLVMRKVHEEILIPREKDWTVQIVGPWSELLECGQLNAAGVAALREVLPLVGRSGAEALDRAGGILFWLLRAWAERDPYSKFLALFVPLEMALQGVYTSKAAADAQTAEQIRKVISEADADVAPRLLQYFDSIIALLSPSLNQRFEEFASRANTATRDRDVAAFRKFNKIRNDLLHRGVTEITLSVKVEDEVQPLEDLVERYVSFALFGRIQVYASRWRPRLEPKDDTRNA